MAKAAKKPRKKYEPTMPIRIPQKTIAEAIAHIELAGTGQTIGGYFESLHNTFKENGYRHPSPNGNGY